MLVDSHCRAVLQATLSRKVDDLLYRLGLNSLPGKLTPKCWLELSLDEVLGQPWLATLIQSYLHKQRSFY